MSWLHPCSTGDSSWDLPGILSYGWYSCSTLCIWSRFYGKNSKVVLGEHSSCHCHTSWPGKRCLIFRLMFCISVFAAVQCLLNHSSDNITSCTLLVLSTRQVILREGQQAYFDLTSWIMRLPSSNSLGCVTMYSSWPCQWSHEELLFGHFPIWMGTPGRVPVRVVLPRWFSCDLDDLIGRDLNNLFQAWFHNRHAVNKPQILPYRFHALDFEFHVLFLKEIYL